MVMSACLSIKKGDENLFIVYKAATNVWIWKALDCHCPIFDAEETIELYFVWLDLILSSRILSKSS